MAGLRVSVNSDAVVKLAGKFARETSGQRCSAACEEMAKLYFNFQENAGMRLLDDLKEKVQKMSPELSEKASHAMNRTKEVAVEVSKKASPMIKDIGEKTVDFAKEKSPIIKNHGIKLFGDIKTRWTLYQERIKQEKAARDEMIRTMYDITRSPDDENFMDEVFRHFDHEICFFTLSGRVLDTQKRSNTVISASHSHSVSLFNGSGFSDSSMHVSSHNTTEHEFWIRLADGSEACFGVPDSRIQMRAEQWLTLVFVRATNTNDGALCAVYNHAAKKYQAAMIPSAINTHFGLHTEEPGWFSENEVMAIRYRLLKALDRRLVQIGQHVALHCIPPFSPV